MVTPPTFIPRTWYLIQRFNPTDDWRRDNKTKIDRYVSCDYMGSAEFEFGALPASIKLIRDMASKDELVFKEALAISSLRGTKVPTWVICHREAAENAIVEKLVSLSDGRTGTPLKEPTYYDEVFVKPRFTRGSETHGWLVLDNEFPLFFFVNKRMAHEVWLEMSGKSQGSEKAPVPAQGILAENLTLFQRVSFTHKGHDVAASIVGIFDEHAQVKLESDGSRISVSYNDLETE